MWDEGLESAKADVMGGASEFKLREREDETEERNGFGSESGFKCLSYSLGQVRAEGRGEPHRAVRTVGGNGLCKSP